MDIYKRFSTIMLSYNCKIDYSVGDNKNLINEEHKNSLIILYFRSFWCIKIAISRSKMMQGESRD